MKVKELHEQERPREKALEKGIEVLSNRELIAILLRTGSKELSALELADEILHRFDNLGELGKASVHEMMNIKGVKDVKAITLLAGFELGRRIAYEKVRQCTTIQQPEDVFDWLNQLIGYEKQEHFLVLFLNQRNQIVTYKDLFIGTMTSASVHPREIFREAMRLQCAKILCVHNHPSGNCEPSKADIDLTNSIVECGKMTAIPLLDHIIVGKNTYISFRQKRLID